MKQKDENAKDPHWQVPMDLPHVRPEDYDKNIDSGRGSATGQKPQPITPKKQPGTNESRNEQKARGAFPQHDEPIGGG